MKTILLGLHLLIGSVAAAELNQPAVHLGDVRAIGPRSNVWFLFNVTFVNDSTSLLKATNLFSDPPGLALKVFDLNGKILTTTFAVRLHASEFAFPPHSQKSFKLSYGVPSISHSYQMPGIAL